MLQTAYHAIGSGGQLESGPMFSSSSEQMDEVLQAYFFSVLSIFAGLFSPHGSVVSRVC